MQKHVLITSIFITAALSTVAGCPSSQVVRTTDSRAIVTDNKPQVDDDTGLVSYKSVQTGKAKRTSHDQVKNMNKLDNQFSLLHSATQ